VARGRLDDIDGALARLSELDAEGGDSWQAPQVAVTRAVLELGAGRLDAAFDAARAAQQWSGDIGDADVDTRLWHVLTQVAIHRGEPAEARSRIADAERRGVPTAVKRALLAAADDARAAATLVRELTQQTAPWPEELLVEAACTAHHGGDIATLRDAGELLAALAARNPGVTSIAGAATLVESLVVGEPAPAVELLRRAPRPLLLARAEEELGRAALGRGDRSGVESLLRARDGYAACGATAARTRVQRSLQSAGVRRRGKEPRSRPESGWDSLTEMERRVAVLISDGHTNRAAAAELFVSPSTINTHLRAVFSKLGVHSRVQLAKQVLARSVDQDPGTPSARHQER